MYPSYAQQIAKLGDVVSAERGNTSFFSTPSESLDPYLFDGNTLSSSVRSEILDVLFAYLATNFSSPEKWVDAWLAGSGVSYQWEASREPGDLDCLIGINYPVFRQNNFEYQRFSNAEIASMFNENFSRDLMPKTRNWHGYELTFYVNRASDIRDINPYAAYDLIKNEWTVSPKKEVPPYSKVWEQRVHRDYSTGVDLINRYVQALGEVRAAAMPAHRVNAESKLKLAVEQAVSFYDDIHGGRKTAFSGVGAGYADFNNYRWQAGKRSGVVPALKKIKDYHTAAKESNEMDTYGVTLPNTDVLVRRAASSRFDNQ